MMIIFGYNFTLDVVSYGCEIFPLKGSCVKCLVLIWGCHYYFKG
jgi:hypothetical protein